ncbi:MAG: cupredoxin domain-containing protein [Chloroflexi bacterium]|nr:cupredoxin domain-containing protein [Chloroflexota bacterium]
MHPSRTIFHAALALATASAVLAAVLPGAVAAPQAQQASVSLVDNRMEPQNLTVTVGTRVTWTNNGALPHTVTSDTGLFNSGTLTAGQTFSYTFNAAGAFPYNCNFHRAGGMVGTITVQAAPQPTPPPPAPTPAPKPPAAPTVAPKPAPTPTVAAKPAATPAPAKPAATLTPKPAAPPVPKAGADLPLPWLALLGSALSFIGLAIRQLWTQH